MPDARCTRGPVCKWVMKNAHEHTGSAEDIRHSLRNGFTAYSALSLATNSSCHHRQRINGSVRARLGRRTSANLTPATDAGTTRLHRTQQHRSSVRRSIAHGSKPALQFTCAPNAAASTASNPASVTIAIRPSLWDRDGGGYRGDLGLARRGMFLQARLDRANHVELVQEISAAAQHARPHPRVTASPLRGDEVREVRFQFSKHQRRHDHGGRPNDGGPKRGPDRCGEQENRQE